VESDDYVTCEHCDAIRFRSERQGICCANGSVELTPYIWPDEMIKLLDDPSFGRQLRAYNAAFSISSVVGANRDNSVNNGLSQTYRVSGQTYQAVGSLHPGQDKYGQQRDRQFGQMYLFDPDMQDGQRAKLFQKLNPEKLSAIRRILEKKNPYVQLFKNVRSKLMQNQELRLAFNTIKKARYDQYEPPKMKEVGAVLDEGTAHLPLQVIMERKMDGKLSFIKDHHSSFDAIRYPLLHTRGEQGWHNDIPAKNRRRSRVSMREYYAYHVFDRELNKGRNPLHLCGPLSQMYWVDQVATSRY